MCRKPEHSPGGKFRCCVLTGEKRSSHRPESPAGQGACTGRLDPAGSPSDSRILWSPTQTGSARASEAQEPASALTPCRLSPGAPPLQLQAPGQASFALQPRGFTTAWLPRTARYPGVCSRVQERAPVQAWWPLQGTWRLFPCQLGLVGLGSGHITGWNLTPPALNSEQMCIPLGAGGRKFSPLREAPHTLPPLQAPLEAPSLLWAEEQGPQGWGSEPRPSPSPRGQRDLRRQGGQPAGGLAKRFLPPASALFLGNARGRRGSKDLLRCSQASVGATNLFIGSGAPPGGNKGLQTGMPLPGPATSQATSARPPDCLKRERERPAQPGMGPLELSSCAESADPALALRPARLVPTLSPGGQGLQPRAAQMHGGRVARGSPALGQPRWASKGQGFQGGR